MNTRADVIIVGGGIIGCSIAYYLAKAGVTSCVLEKDRIGGQASQAAAGLLIPIVESHQNVDARRLGIESLGLYPSIAKELLDSTGIDIEYVPSSILKLATDDSEVEALSAQADSEEALAEGLSWLSSHEIAEIEPGLTQSVRGALLSTSEGHVNSIRLTQALARAAAGLGVRFMEGIEVSDFLRRDMTVTGVMTSSGSMEASHVVLASGAWSGGLARALGLNLPVRPVRGQILALQPAPAVGAPRHVIYHLGTYLVQKRDGSVWVGATQEEAGFHQQVTAEGIASLLNAAICTIPGLKDATLLRAWCGLRPGSADGMPVLGSAGELDGLVLATGHFRHGVLLAPITGQLIAQHIVEGETTLPSPFSFGRFDNEELSY